jgi:hypothetical protein
VKNYVKEVVIGVFYYYRKPMIVVAVIAAGAGFIAASLGLF